MGSCNRCLLSDKRINIDFSPEGTCNYCRSYDKVRSRISDFSTLERLFLDRINAIRGHAEFDCMVGLSGGKDSSYVAYALVKKYGLNPLLITFDNGFLTNYARNNIARVVKMLGKKHIMVGLDQPVLRSVYRASTKRFGIPCLGCTFSGMAVMLKQAIEYNIPFFIHGRTHAQMFRGLTEGSLDPFFMTIWSNYTPYDPKAARRVAYKITKRLRRFVKSLIIDPALQPGVDSGMLPDIHKLKKMEYPPEMVGYFVFEKYDESRIMNELEKNLQWHRPDSSEILGHHDCDLHQAAIYYYNLISGQSMLSEELSVMMREGYISREEAEERLRKETGLGVLSEESVRSISSITGMSLPEIHASASRALRKYNILKALVKLRFALLPRPRLPL